MDQQPPPKRIPIPQNAIDVLKRQASEQAELNVRQHNEQYEMQERHERETKAAMSASAPLVATEKPKKK